MKRVIILLSLIILPAFAEYDPMSDEPINSVEEFYSQQNQTSEEATSPEFEYTAGETPEVVEVKPTKDYAGIYNSLEPAKHSYMHLNIFRKAHHLIQSL